jgi:glycosyltransferase involved in cell wall biosynthesis
MRIAHIATSLHGGAGIAAFRIHESLIQSNVCSSLFTLSGPAELTSHAKVFLLKRSTIEKTISKIATVTQEKLVQRTKQLFTPISIHTEGISRISDFDLIHLHNIYNMTNLKQVSHLFGQVPIVLTLHDMRNFTGGCHYSCGCKKFKEDSCVECPQSHSIFQPLVKKKMDEEIQLSRTFSRIAIAAPSKWILEHVRCSTMWNNRPARLIHNPIPNPSRTISQRTKNSINQIGFISPSLHNPYKGFSVLSEALASLPKSWWKLNKVLFVGEGVLPNFLPSSRIERVPSRHPQEMMSLYKQLDFLVIPSIQDNFPNIIGEAAVHGVNLILSDVGGLPEAAEMFGFQMFESGNPKSLTRCLLNLRKIEKPYLIANAQDIFSYQRASHAYQELYNLIVS